MSSIYEWSLNADANGNSDDIINWQEGQPPSSVNDSARAMMRRIAEYLGDLSGTANVQGNGNELSINASSPISKYKDGLRIYYKQNITNIKNLQIQLGNLGLKPVFQSGATGLIPTPAGACQAGCIYEIIYSSALQPSGGWFLTNPTRLSKPAKMPAGSIACFSALTLKSLEWLLCDGSELRKIEYKQLYAAIGDVWGATKKGPDFFKIPDLRGVFLRGFDSGRGLDAKREFASYQEDANKEHTHKIICEEAGEHTHRVLGPGGNVRNSLYPQQSAQGPSTYYKPDIPAIEPAGKHKHNIVCEDDGASEARPKNYALHYMIKT
ncbi:MAG: phage tail protein [Alphaproteobacteria bacterium]|nr:phage tail protein [Alphaproteobacteria bacterium]